jgi:hypothetical protein
VALEDRVGPQCCMRWAWLIVGLAAVGCHSKPVCGSSDCAGCCGPDGGCALGDEGHACGSGGEVCADCLGAGQLCSVNACVYAQWPTPDSGAAFDAGYVSVPLTAWCTSQAEAVCTWFERCGRLDEAQRADCVAIETFGCTQPIYDELADGGATYSPERAAACLDAIAASECVGGRQPPGIGAPPCAQLAVGAIPTGAGCPPGVGNVCTNGYCKGNTCPATCTALTPIGAQCASDDECGPEAYCSGGQPPSCIGYKDLGGDCSPPDLCLGAICDWGQGQCIAPGALSMDAACSDSRSCGYGLYCQSPPGYPVGVCTPWAPQGGSCSSSECGAGLTCIVPDGGARGTCEPESTLGGPCSPSGGCVAGLLCSSAGTCVGWAGLGEACDSSIQNCKVALWCDPAGVCALLPRIGDICADSSGRPLATCFDGRCDFSSTLRCVARQPDGAFCATDSDCTSDTCSSSSSCQPDCTSF